MQLVLTQLSVLVVLTGVSVAVIQYLFVNHQTHLKDFIASLKEISFNETNHFDRVLSERWESAINSYKKHTYLINPNDSILFGFLIIILLVSVYIAVSLSVVNVVVNIDWIKIAIFIIAVGLLLWLILNLVILMQMFKKEASIKFKLNSIDKQHQLVEKVLNKAPTSTSN